MPPLFKGGNSFSVSFRLRSSQYACGATGLFLFWVATLIARRCTLRMRQREARLAQSRSLQANRPALCGPRKRKRRKNAARFRPVRLGSPTSTPSRIVSTIPSGSISHASTANAAAIPRVFARPSQQSRILFVTPEFGDVGKVGGLGAVSAALPRALRRQCDVRVLVPAYRQVLAHRSSIQIVGATVNCSLAFPRVMSADLRRRTV